IEYTYDPNGNMLTDANKGITNILYDHLNLPTQVFINNPEHIGNISYIYDASGVKLKKVTTEGSSVTTTEYAGDYIYENNSLRQISTAEGYVEKDGLNFRYVYYYKDHQNNVRLTYSDLDGNGLITPSTEILHERNYYPFGLVHKGYNSNINGPVNNYKQYQDQEFTEDLGLNTHEWKFRVSDPAIGRFWQVDPLSEKYAYNGTYNFSENRVIDGVELEGLEWQNADGKLIYDPNKDNGDGTRGGYTEHATKNDKNIGSSLLMTEKGTEQFNKLVNSEHPIEIKIENGRGKGEDGTPISGKTDNGSPGLFKDMKTGKIEDVEVIKSVITLFFGSISDTANAEQNGEIGHLADRNVDGLSFEQILGAILGHEIEHSTNKDNIILHVTGASKEQVEKKPNEVTNEIIDQLKQKN
ncbi:MAG: hypothetical protein CVU07_12955, partial [Bacteroidetes bacterium HGW-Bacteroidetes-23]